MKKITIFLILGFFFLIVLNQNILAEKFVYDGMNNGTFTQFNSSEGGADGGCVLDTISQINGTNSTVINSGATDLPCYRRPFDYSRNGESFNVSFTINMSHTIEGVWLGMKASNTNTSIGNLASPHIEYGNVQSLKWTIKGKNANTATDLTCNINRLCNIVIAFSRIGTNESNIVLSVNGSESTNRSVAFDITTMDIFGFHTASGTPALFDDLRIYNISATESPQNIPVGNTSGTIPASPEGNQSIFINVTLSNKDNHNFQWVNFTIRRPDSSVVQTQQNGTQHTAQATTASQEWHSVNFTITRNGRWRWNVSFFDGININQSLNNFFEVAPSPNITQLLNPSGIWGNNQSIYLNFTAQDNDGLSECWYQLLNKSDLTQVLKTNTTVACTNGVNTQITFSTKFINVSENYTLQLFVNDSFNNIINSSINFTVVQDSTPPNVTITAPSGTIVIRSNIALTYTANDTSAGGVSECSYRITDINNNNIIANTTIVGCGSTTFSVSSDGDYRAFVMANDTSSNSFVANSSFTVDIPKGQSGGGGGGSPEEKSQEGLEIRITNLFNTRASKIFIEKGKLREYTLKVRNNGTKTQNVVVSCTESDICNWISYEKQSLKLLPTESKEVLIKINVPETVKVGEQYSFISLARQDISHEDIHTITMSVLPTLKFAEIMKRNFFGIFQINLGNWKKDSNGFPIPNIILTLIVEGAVFYFFIIQRKAYTTGGVFLFLGFVVVSFINNLICYLPIIQCVGG